MLIVKYSNQFKKDLNKIKKRGLEIEKLKKIIETLANGEKLMPKYKDHCLIGDYKRL